MEGNISRLQQGISTSLNIPQPPAEPEKKEDMPEIPRDSYDKRHHPEAGSHAPQKGRKGQGASSYGQKEPELKEYTILSYMDGSNNLEDCIVDDVKEMEGAPASAHYDLAVQLSRYQTSSLTVIFLAEALSQAFKSREVRQVMGQMLGDGEIFEKYGELLKDRGICQRISTVLLRRNPPLQEKLDKIVKAKVRETANNDETVGDVIVDTASQILGQVYAVQNKKDEEATVGAQAKSIGANLLEIMEGSSADDKTPVIADILKATGEFIKSSEGGNDLEVLAAGATKGGAESGRGSIVFLDSPIGEGRYEQGDFTGLLSQAKDVEINKEPSWRGVRRYHITHSDDKTRINSKPLANLAYRDMAKVETLADFIAWGMKKFPAQHYIVTLSDHGAGFLGAEEDRGNMLSLPQLREAFELAEKKTGKKPDIIAFDACLMAQAEVAHELKDRAQYLIASEEVVGGDGYPYKGILPGIDKALSEGKSDPRQIASVFIEEGEKTNEKATFTLAALDLGAIKDITSSVDSLAGHILEGKADLEAVKSSFKQAQQFNVGRGSARPYDDFKDLWDLADKLEKNTAITDPAIRKDLRDLKGAVEKFVVREEHIKDEDYEGSHGVSIYAPRKQKSASIPLFEEYGKTSFVQECPKWNELIKKLTDFEALQKKSEEEKGKPRLTFIPLPPRA
jgi:hypothetical protein